MDPLPVCDVAHLFLVRHWKADTCLRSSVVAKRKMAPGIADIEGSTHGHDVVPVKAATKYLESRGLAHIASLYNDIKPHPSPYLYIGSSKEVGANRVVFGEAVNMVLDTLSKEEAAKKVMVIDSACHSLLCSTSADFAVVVFR